MFEVSYFIYAVLVVLFFAPLIVHLFYPAVRALCRGLRVTVWALLRCTSGNFAEARARYNTEVTLSMIEYAAISFLLALNLGILAFGVIGPDPLVWKVAGGLFALSTLFTTTHLVLKRSH